MNIVITGATSGIGKSLTQHYLKQEHTVIGTGRNTAVLEEIRSTYSNFTPVSIDLTDREQCLTKLSKLSIDPDLVILNAGNCEYVEVDQFDAKLFERVYAINVLAQVYCLEALLPKLSDGSHLSFISSSATMLPFPKAEAYGSSKAAVDYLAESLRVDLTRKGIHVSLVQPGFVDTPLTQANTFGMPFLMSPEDAAAVIAKGLEKRKFRIRFPNSLISMLIVLNWLPKKWLAKALTSKD